MDGSPGASESTDPERAGQVPAVPTHQQAATKGSPASGGADVSSVSLLGHGCVRGVAAAMGPPKLEFGSQVCPRLPSVRSWVALPRGACGDSMRYSPGITNINEQH